MAGRQDEVWSILISISRLQALWLASEELGFLFIPRIQSLRGPHSLSTGEGGLHSEQTLFLAQYTSAVSQAEKDSSFGAFFFKIFFF